MIGEKVCVHLLNGTRYWVYLTGITDEALVGTNTSGAARGERVIIQLQDVAAVERVSAEDTNMCTVMYRTDNGEGYKCPNAATAPRVIKGNSPVLCPDHEQLVARSNFKQVQVPSYR